ncbi:MAG: GH36-type glycosyl hydrolase domain-containing protein, partial [Turicibacter sp.]
PDEVGDLLWNNFAGIRVDGSNATIIGAKKGEFIADRNSIARVWMDHGAWPFLTTKLYIDRSGDLAFLLKNQTYFKDKLVARSSRGDELWCEAYGNKQKNLSGEIYEGSILEHLLMQHLTAFYNVGAHNIIKLEGADWNDAFDMGKDKGESVSFTALYASNLEQLADLLVALKEKLNVDQVDLMKELSVLLTKTSAHDIQEKNDKLTSYFNLCEHSILGEKEAYDVLELSGTLKEMARSMKETINQNEWVESSDGLGWFNGYYDNCGEKVEGEFETGPRMTLTGQVFSIMGNVADDERVKSMIKSADEILYSPKVGGYRLNSNFFEVKLDLGRCFGFAFGHKENGAMFSHMALMYSNALYQRGFKEEGFKVLDTIYHHCIDFEKSRIYPGIPEYVNERGRGMYNYLTGSASWLLLTVVQEVFGIKGDLGDLIIAPNFTEKQIHAQKNCSITSLFADRLITFVYEGDILNGKIMSVNVGDIAVAFTPQGNGVQIKREEVIDKIKNGETLTLSFE